MGKTVIRMEKDYIIIYTVFHSIFYIIYFIFAYICFVKNDKDLIIIPFLGLFIQTLFFIPLINTLYIPIVFDDKGIKFKGKFHSWEKSMKMSISHGSYESSENGTVFTSKLILSTKSNAESINLSYFKLKVTDDKLIEIFTEYKTEWKKNNKE